MRAHDSLGPVGLVLAVLSQIPAVAAKLPGQPRYYLAAGLALVVLHVGLRFEDIARLIGKRQLRHGGNAVVLVFAVLAILGIVNWATNRNTVRWDLTKSGKFSLSDQTKKVVGGLTEELRITHFYASGEQADRSNQETRDRLREFGLASSKIKVEDIDARNDPKRTRDADIKAVPTLILEYKGKREQTNSGSEQDLTAAIIKLTREGKKTVCFLKGEAERDSASPERTGYAAAKALLEKSQYATQDFSLAQKVAVPEGCTVVLIAGAESDLSTESASVLREFVKKGGRMFVLFEPDFKKVGLPNLTGLAKDWNIEVGEDIALDLTPTPTPYGLALAPGERLIVPPEQYPYHEITRSLGLVTYYDGSRRIVASKESRTGVTATNLIETSPDSWAETDLSLKEDTRFEEGKDTRGPLGIAAVATIKSAEPPPTPVPSPAPSPAAPAPKAPEARVAVFGDTDFASNALIRKAPGNEALFLGTVAWLTGDEDLISIPPRAPDDHRITLMPQTFSFWAVLVTMAFGMPLLFVALGIVTWWRRR